MCSVSFIERRRILQYRIECVTSDVGKQQLPDKTTTLIAASSFEGAIKATSGLGSTNAGQLDAADSRSNSAAFGRRSTTAVEDATGCPLVALTKTELAGNVTRLS